MGVDHQVHIAKWFNVGQHIVSRIGSGKRWFCLNPVGG